MSKSIELLTHLSLYFSVEKDSQGTYFRWIANKSNPESARVEYYGIRGVADQIDYTVDSFWCETLKENWKSNAVDSFSLTKV